MSVIGGLRRYETGKREEHVMDGCDVVYCVLCSVSMHGPPNSGGFMWVEVELGSIRVGFLLPSRTDIYYRRGLIG